MRTIKHLAFAAMAVSALALAGCGGGGSSSTMVAPSATPTTPPETTTPPAPTPVTLPSDGNAYLAAADLTLEDDTISLAAGGSMDVGAYTLSCSAAGPCEITIEDGDVEATGTVTATYTTAAMTTINNAKIAQTDEMHMRSLGVGVALIGDTAASSDSPSAKITRGESGAASISLKGWTGSAAASTGAEGWSGMMFEGAGLLNKGQSMAVYTNIEAAKRKALGHATDDSITTGVLYSSTAVEGVTWNSANGALALGGTLGAAQAAHLDKARFPQPGSTKATTYGTGTSDTHEREFPGTFRGASGTYSCAPATDVCSVTAPGSNAASKNYTLVGTWTFEPGAGQRGIEEDTSHLNFGWWIKTPSEVDSGGDYVYDVEVFSRAVGTIRVDDLGLLTGTARYEGPAAGVYVNRTGEGDSLAATHGTFTASAELVANFDKADADATATLSGEVGAFSGGTEMDDWSVKLGAVDVATGSGATATGVAGGKTSGTGTGTWSASFHGGAAGTAPAGVHGTFNAHSNTTNIVGAFGADRQ